MSECSPRARRAATPTGKTDGEGRMSRALRAGHLLPALMHAFTNLAFVLPAWAGRKRLRREYGQRVSADTIPRKEYTDYAGGECVCLAERKAGGGQPEF